MMTYKREQYACIAGIFFALTIGANAMDTAAIGNHPAVSDTMGSKQTSLTQPIEASKFFHGVGFVTAIAPTGSLTINHQPIDGLMPAMEMMFSVNPRTLIKGLHPGDKITFEVEGKTYVIVGLKVVEQAQ